MPKMARPKSRDQLRTRRHFRLRKKVVGSAERPRLVVYRSIKHIYAQLVDDSAQRTLMTVTDSGLSGKPTERSVEVGKRIAAKAKDAGVKRVVFAGSSAVILLSFRCSCCRRKIELPAT